MTSKPTIYQHAAYSPSIQLGDNDQLIGERVVRGGTLVGHVLFADSLPMVQVNGTGIRIEGCRFEFEGSGAALHHVPLWRRSWNWLRRLRRRNSFERYAKAARWEKVA